MSIKIGFYQVHSPVCLYKKKVKDINNEIEIQKNYHQMYKERENKEEILLKFQNLGRVFMIINPSERSEERLY